MIQLPLAALLAICAGCIDAHTGRIPNWLTLPALGAALVARGVVEGASGLLSGAVGALVVGIVPYLLFALSKGRAIGGGDVKLFAALGAWLGPSLGIEAQFLGFVCLLLWAFVLLAWRGRLLAVLFGSLQLAVGWALPRRFRRPPTQEEMTSLRMGPAIAAGTLCVVLLESTRGQLPWPG